ncbi:Major Facilitator Superfamily protein [compost metagenome]
MLFMCLSGFFNALSMPAIQAFIGFRFAERRSELFNVIYVANNIGVAVGTSLSGILAFVSYQLSFVLNGVTSLLFAIFFFVYLQRVTTDNTQLKNSTRKSVPRELSTWQLLMNYRLYLFMGLGSFLIWFGNCIWNNGVSPYTILQGMPEWNYSILWTLNGVLIFIGQPITTWIKDVMTKTPGTQLIISAIFYALGYVVILIFQDYSSMVIGMILTTFGEMLVLPAIPTFISERTGANAPFYLGLVGGLGVGGKVLGPYALGALFDWNGLPPVAWVSLIAAIGALVAFAIHATFHREEKQLALETQISG